MKYNISTHMLFNTFGFDYFFFLIFFYFKNIPLLGANWVIFLFKPRLYFNRLRSIYYGVDVAEYFLLSIRLASGEILSYFSL